MLIRKHELITIPPNREFTFTFEQLNLNSIFQRLWLQLSIYMRDYIYASTMEGHDLEASMERLFRLPGDFYNAIYPFYGAEIASLFRDIFTNFIARASRVTEGVKANDQALVDKSVQEWYQNADQLAGFLARINLYWDENQWRNLLYQYVNLKNHMIVAAASGNYRQEIQLFDSVFDLTSIMGTYMARGLFARQLQRGD